MSAVVAKQIERVAAPVRFLPVRDDALLVETADLAATLALFAAMRQHPVEGVTELVPAARTLLVRFMPAVASPAQLAAAILALPEAGQDDEVPETVEIPVHYDGEDLPEAAALLGMSVDELTRAHQGSDYVVAFTGFAPGFAYLSGGDPRLTIPRRKTPRTSVPAGSVGLAGAFSGVYPKASPGGWQLIGTTPLAMFDLDREPATLLRPGAHVRFVDAGKRRATVVAKTPSARRQADDLTCVAKLTILSSAMPVLVQDLGRPGQAAQGVSVSGAADKASLKLANCLVGNAPGAAALEMVYGNLRLAISGRGVLALTGAHAPAMIEATNGERFEAGFAQPIPVEDGDILTLGAPTAGFRTYLAIRGGVAAKPAMGSAATDTLAQIGPEPLGAGAVIAVGKARLSAATGQWSDPAPELPRIDEVVSLDVHLGPRTDWINQASVQAFLDEVWTVTPQSNRIGLRLSGPVLARAINDELPSEATLQGAVQIPADGRPVLFLADHPLTGGYPVIAHLARHHLDLAGQIAIGSRIRFNAVSDFIEIEPAIAAARPGLREFAA